MKNRNIELNGVLVFLSVARHLSFRQASDELDISPAAVSKAIRQLESQHGVVLFQRTTRSVALTDAGHAFYQRMQPALAQIDQAMEELASFQKDPRGRLRLTVSRSAMRICIETVVPEFHRAYPNIELDISVNDGFVDLQTHGFDAGVRLGELIAQDMVAIRLTPRVAWSVVGSPAYFEAHGVPATPEELVGHRAINYRFAGSGQLHVWEFVRDGKPLHVERMQGFLTVNERQSLLAFARDGLGLAYVADMEARADLDGGALVAVLREHIPSDSGFFLYFPSRMHSQPKLRAFIEVATRRLKESSPAR